MGAFSQALTVADGMTLANELKGLRSQMDLAVQGVVDLTQDYAGFRAKLGDDQEDLAVADQSLAEAIAAAKVMLDALQPGPRAIFVSVIEGLGFQAVE